MINNFFDLRIFIFFNYMSVHIIHAQYTRRSLESLILRHICDFNSQDSYLKIILQGNVILVLRVFLEAIPIKPNQIIT